MAESGNPIAFLQPTPKHHTEKTLPGENTYESASEKNTTNEIIHEKIQSAKNDAISDPSFDGFSAIPEKNGAPKPSAIRTANLVSQTSPSVSAVTLDLGRFLFPGVVTPPTAKVNGVASGKSSGGVPFGPVNAATSSSGKSPEAGSALQTNDVLTNKSSGVDGLGLENVPQRILAGSSKEGFEGSPEINGSSQILEGAGTDSPVVSIPQVHILPTVVGGQNKVAVPENPSPLASDGSKGGSHPSANILDAVFADTLARFPDSVWKEAAAIVAEILKHSPSGVPPQ
ncbi:hypothetical protein OROHE_021241 [Orobanche hederae]